MDKGRTGAPREPIKVLVVDDDEHIRVLCCEALCAAGYAAEPAVNGMDALARLGAGGYAAVITDVNMPVLDGIGFYLKAIEAEPRLTERFIFMTGRVPGAPGAVKAFSPLGKNWIVKPFSIGELLAQVERVLGVIRPGRGLNAERRFEERFPWEEECRRIQGEDGSAFAPFAKTRDISMQGLSLRHGGNPLEPGSALRLDIRLLDLRCVVSVVWSSGPDGLESVSGLRLSVPMRPSVMEMVMRANGA